MIVLIKFFGVH